MSLRSDVIAAAQSHLGEGPRREWLGYQWCGMFALACLHEAGLGGDIAWRIGGGFLREHPEAFMPTTYPMLGDIGVQPHPPWHHVLCISRDGDRVRTIAGNTGASPGKVSCSTCSIDDYLWYSIESLEAVP